MPAAIFHLTNTDNAPHRYAIEQGTTLNWLTLVLDGDYTTWQPRGQIRDRYASEGGKIKSTFAFAPLTIGEVTLPNGQKINGTIIRPQLTDEQTTTLDWAESKMVKRASLKDVAIPGRNVWVYDVELESPSGEVMRVAEGWIEVALEATK
jgi:hypothetical protein